MNILFMISEAVLINKDSGESWLPYQPTPRGDKGQHKQ